MKCSKCNREVDEGTVSAAIKLGDGRAALCWLDFERMLKPGRVAEVMRLVRAATETLRATPGAAKRARGEQYLNEPE